MECGVVLSEGALVSEVSFGETSGGAAMAHGTLVAEGSTHARTGGGRRGGEESSEQAIYNGRIRIAQIATAMNIPDTLRESALRFYKLAIAQRFTKGRRSRLVVAACLYAACQHVQFGFMLIDFSDLLQINVFVLGATYLKLIKVLNMPRPYAIDPAHYIARFAALLEFGDETPKVAHDAARLVKRFRADWMNTGRRPAGICGACLLIAARMNNFRRSVQEIVQVVKIAEQTVVKRLEEFKGTGSSGLTVNEFRDDEKWLPEASEVPPILKAQERKKARMLKRKRKRGEDEDADGEAETDRGSEVPEDNADVSQRSVSAVSPDDNADAATQKINFRSGIFRDVGLGEEDLYPNGLGPPPEAGSIPPSKPLFLLDDDEEGHGNAKLPIDKTAEAEFMFSPSIERQQQQDFNFVIDPALLNASFDSPSDENEKDDELDDQEIASEVQTLLHAPQAEEVSAEVEEEEQLQRGARKKRGLVEDKLDDLDEEELNAFLLTEEEVKLKTRVWVELNREYLEKIAAKGLDEEEGVSAKKKSKPKKPKQTPRDSMSARGATPAEAVGHLLKKPKFSRKINYSAVETLFKSPVAISKIGKAPMSSWDDAGDTTNLQIDEEDADREIVHHVAGFGDDEGAESGVYAVGEGYGGQSAGGEEDGIGEDEYYDDGGYQEEV
ncbi:transcription factor TFIIIB subunit brf1 [Tulasnella sp. 330]|nr:transcription factor TFIIIB subunit brf1 [Tulasnella sp. 330]KAG8872049.1 transcription factor TFIIIB subunit brf1 [Tulasnella sp. 331]